MFHFLIIGCTVTQYIILNILLCFFTITLRGLYVSCQNEWNAENGFPCQYILNRILSSMFDGTQLTFLLFFHSFKKYCKSHLLIDGLVVNTLTPVATDL